MLNKRADDNQLNIKNAYQKFIKNKVPIEIFVKQYKQDSNSLLYDLNTTTNDDKIQITLHNNETKDTYTTGAVDGFFDDNNLSERLKKVVHDKRNIVIMAYGQSVRNESSLFFDNVTDNRLIENLLNSLDKNISELTVRFIQIFYKWSHEWKKDTDENSFCLSSSETFNSKRERDEWKVLYKNENKN